MGQMIRYSIARMLLLLVVMVKLRSYSGFRTPPSNLQAEGCLRGGRRPLFEPASVKIRARHYPIGVGTLICGLQITVRIRGKKSREEDYTNQVRRDQIIFEGGATVAR